MMLVVLGLPAQNTVDTEEFYETVRDSLKEFDDCTVRMTASIFDKSYIQAHRELSKIGRKKRRALHIKDLLYYVDSNYRERITNYYDFQRKQSRTVPVSQFIKHIARTGHRYIIITTAHVFTIKEDELKEWTVYGNLDDYNKEVHAFIEIN